MANTPFFARHGLVVNNFLTVNSTTVAVASNISINTSALFVGNTTANLLANSILLSLSNSTSIANLSPLALTIGSAVSNALGFFTGSVTVNTIAVGVGANVFLETTRFSVGNTIANLIANSILLKVSNATSTANLTPLALTIGSSVINATHLSVTTGVSAATLTGGVTTVNTTHIYVGGGTTNVVWHLGNDGSGSGLDADLLDGQDSSFYTAITTRLGYTPLNKAGDTTTGQLVANTGQSVGTLATATGSLGGISVQGAGGANAAFMNFIRPSNWGGYFGLDTDNVWKVGGWSHGAVAYTLWHSGNDGSGSGLDADLLDGHDASYFQVAGGGGATPGGSDKYVQFNDSTTLNGTAGLTWTKTTNTLFVANLATIGATTVNTTHIYVGGGVSNLVWHAGNDGSGSGLDADLFDGQDGSYYTNIAARLGYTPLNSLSPTATGTATIGATTVNTTHIYIGGGSANIVWHAGNDGSGSGLDADFLDGHDTSFFVAASAYTAADVLAKLITVDGSGTGLDADLLDGHDTSYFQVALGYTPINSSDIMTAAQFRANTATKILSTDKVWESAGIVTLTDGGTISVDFSTGFNFVVTLAGNRAVANPTNCKVGQAGIILIKQDGSGSHTLTFGANWKFPSGTPPTLTTSAGAVDKLFYFVESSSIIHAEVGKDSR